MSVNIHLIKKWTSMMLGKSISHVNQGIGRVYSKDHIAGFYNDLTEKVYKRNCNSDVPVSKMDDGSQVYFVIEIAQYGLGAFDIYLQTSDQYYLKIAENCARWLLDNQESDGSWSTFRHLYPDHPYSSMAQSEGACLFMRLYTVNADKHYLERAEKAINFMLIPVEDGGCTLYDDDEVYLCEYTDPSRSVVLNGWIFSIWCLYDYLKIANDQRIKEVYRKTLSSLTKSLHKFDISYWSSYDLSNRICSPFYHKLHLAQLDVMYDLTGDGAFLEYYTIWHKYQFSFWKSKKAFIVKALQKIRE